MPSKIMRHIKTGIVSGRVERFIRLFEKYKILYTIPTLNTMFINEKLYFYPTNLKIRFKDDYKIYQLNDLLHAANFIGKSLNIKFDYEDIKKYIFTSRRKWKEQQKTLLKNE